MAGLSSELLQRGKLRNLLNSLSPFLLYDLYRAVHCNEPLDHNTMATTEINNCEFAFARWHGDRGELGEYELHPVMQSAVRAYVVMDEDGIAYVK